MKETRRDRRAREACELFIAGQIAKGEVPSVGAGEGLTASELAFREIALVKGMKLTRHGWPDFLVERLDGGFMGVEVKSDSDEVRPSQRTTFAVLERVGIPVFIWRPCRPDRLTPWRKDRGPDPGPKPWPSGLPKKPARRAR